MTLPRAEFQKLTATVLAKLSLEQKAAMAEELLCDLSGAEDTTDVDLIEIEKAWIREAKRRMKDHLEGRDPGIPGDDVFREALESLK